MFHVLAVGGIVAEKSVLAEVRLSDVADCVHS